MNDDARIDQAKRAIARVEVAAQPGRAARNGSAFCIAEGLVLTARHVLAPRGAPWPSAEGAIQLRFDGSATAVAAQVVPELVSDDGDWAVLRCATPPGVVPLELGPPPPRDAAWRCYGYPDIQPDARIGGQMIAGEVRDLPAGPQGLLQLYAQEAAAGEGAPLAGLSGAPCLVDGRAVGILRTTLVHDVTDGAGVQHVHTVAGTVYATPAERVLQWQQARGLALLPPPWGPQPSPLQALAGAGFLVVLSSQEPDGVRSDGDLALADVARLAAESLGADRLAAPVCVSAEALVASPEALRAAVVALCRARAVVFDVSGWEPAVMLLAGIRAVARRGVTLLSRGGDCVLGDELGVPHNLKDANLLVHSQRQSRSTLGASEVLLAERLARGLADIGSPSYLDLPVYDAIRQLPPERRGIWPDEEGVLVLCSFKSQQQSAWERNFKPALARQLDQLRRERQLKGPAAIGPARSFELNSPRLVTQAVYEAIRRMQTCIVDLSGWSPNVLFELGVRLAVSAERTVCTLDSHWQQRAGTGSVTPQQQALAALLVLPAMQYDPARGWQEQAQSAVFAQLYGNKAAPPAPLLASGLVHAQVEQSLDVALEPAARPVHAELLAQAELYSRDPGSGGQSKPVGLFPGNPALTRREEEADFERLMAAWLFLDWQQRRAPDSAGALAMQQLVTALFSRHAGRIDEALGERLVSRQKSAVLASVFPVVLPVVADILQTLQGGAAAPGLSVASAASAAATTCEQARRLKESATARRNQKDHAGALTLLDEAAALLQARLDARPGADPAGQQALQRELADTWGMRGGVLRRDGRLAEALDAYSQGQALEVQLQQGTYNRVNVITLGLELGRRSPRDETLRRDLDDSIAALRAETAGPRRDEWWAWCDLGLLLLLAEKPDEARAAYAAGRRTGPGSDNVGRHADALLALADRLPDAPEIAVSLHDVAAELRMWG